MSAMSSKRYIYSSFSHKIPKLEATQCLPIEWINYGQLAHRAVGNILLYAPMWITITALLLSERSQMEPEDCIIPLTWKSRMRGKKPRKYVRTGKKIQKTCNDKCQCHVYLWSLLSEGVGDRLQGCRKYSLFDLGVYWKDVYMSKRLLSLRSMYFTVCKLHHVSIKNV